MNSAFIKRIKTFIVFALVAIVAGLAVYGFMGFNQNVDNSNSSYEMKVGVTFVAGDAVEVLEESSLQALKDNGLKAVSYQVADEGGEIIFKFNKDVTEKAEAVKNYVQSEINKANLTGVQVKVEVNNVKGSYGTQVVNMVLALAIGLVVASIFVAMLNKFASGFATLCAGTLASILFFALVGATRIPAWPYFNAFIGVATGLAVILSTLITSKYKDALKLNAKANKAEIVSDANNALKPVFKFFALALIVVSAVLAVTTSLWIGLIAFVSGVAGILSAVYFTPLIWSWIKK